MNRAWCLIGLVCWMLLGAGSSRAEEDAAPSYSRAVNGSDSQQVTSVGKKDLEKRVALVIGNADYVRVPKLDNSLNDARDVCKTLRELAFEVLCFENLATRRDMKNAISTFVDQLSKGAIGLFYYAGHGLQVKGENYVIPTAATINVEADVEDETLGLNYVMQRLDEARNSFNLIILDACRNNPLKKSRIGGEGGLAQMDAPAGTMIIYATGPGKVAVDGDTSSRNGLFTAQLLKNMPRPGMPVEEMFKAVVKGVQEDSKRLAGVPQTPWMNSNFSGAFCFAGCEDSQSLKDIAKLKTEREGLEKKAKALEAVNLEREKKLNTLEAEVKRSRDEIEARTKELERNKAEIAVNPSKEKDPEFVKLRDQVTKLEALNQAIKNQAQEQSIQFNRDRDQFNLLKQKLLDLQKQTAEMESLQKKIADLEKQRAEATVIDTPTKERSIPAPRKKGNSTQHLPPTF
jgi:uncharacterized caspase-like protein